MADPRADALMRALGGGDSAPEEGMEQDQPSPESAAAQALSILEPFMEDPRIGKAAQMLQEVAGGPSEPSEDTMSQGQPQMQPGQPAAY